MANSLYCSIRKCWVAGLPEEQIRQRFLLHMFAQGFPPSLISVEQALKQLPHLDPKQRLKAPDRRLDIICFAKSPSNGSLFSPLLLVECKAIKLTSRVMSQIVGYNHFVRSHFICLVNQTEIRMGWYDSLKNSYSFIDFLPSYSELLFKII